MEEHFPELVRPRVLTISHIVQFLGMGRRDPSVVYNSVLNVVDIPYRCATDKATRRLHYYDVRKFLNKDGNDAVNWVKHFDPIVITNIAIWANIHGFRLFSILLDGGVLNSLDTLIDKGSELSSYVKRFTHDPLGLKQAFSEINVLTGHMNNDLQAVDWLEKMMDLAHGGQPHGLEQEHWLTVFEDSLADVSRAPRGRIPKFVTLEEFISSGKWITAGSSSIGRVEWEHDKKTGTFKCRKNMVPLLFTSSDIYTLVMNWNGVTISKAFVKNEVAKRRLAVASNFEAYIMDSYLMYLFGHGWKNWKYITLDETPMESQNRSAEVSRLLKKGCYALPFDYDKFDHQATTPEMMVIVNKMIDTVEVPCWYGETWTHIKKLIQHGYQHGIMRIDLPSGETAETKVTGGLPSGVRLTSLIGNVWNATVTNVVIKMAVELTNRSPKAVAVRGDDTYIISESPAYLGLVRRLYQAVNARGRDTKFGISRGICEFLRNEISSEGLRGWSNRSITSCTQRRPWTAAPWGVDQQVTITRCVIDSASRRVGKPLDFLHRANRTKWSRFYRQSSSWLDLPRRMGGIGIYEDRGLRPSGKLPLAIEDRVRYPNVIPTCPPWVEMTEQQQLEFSRLEMTCRLSTDDVPKASLIRKNELIEAVRATKITWQKVDPIKPKAVYAFCPQPTVPAVWPQTRRHTREVVIVGNNQEVSFEEALATASNVSRATGVSVRDLLQPLFPSTWTEVSRWERNGWHRTDAINLVLGKTPCELVFPLHPELTVFVQDVIRRRCPNWYGREKIASLLYGYTRGSVRSIVDQGGLHVYAY
ncbi:MAG: putative RNA dependent RNA polymerase [Palkane toti-like virus]|nr:MAG: putative RNA dependent RNA polymerase [Palkane toti-like virus]